MPYASMTRTRSWLRNLRQQNAASGTPKEQRINRGRTQGVLASALHDRSTSRAPSEGTKHVCIRSPTPATTPPLDAIIGEGSPERAGDGEQFSAPSSQVSGTSQGPDEEPPEGLSLIVGECNSELSGDDESVWTAPSEPLMLIVGAADDSSNSYASSKAGGGWDREGDDVPMAEEVNQDPLWALEMLRVGEVDGEGSPSSISSELFWGEMKNTLEAEATIDSTGGDCEEALPSMAGEDTSGRSPASSDASGEANANIFRSPRGQLVITALRTMLSMTTSPSMLDSFFPDIAPDLSMNLHLYSTPPPTHSDASDSRGGSPAPGPGNSRSDVHQCLSHLRSRQETVTHAIQRLQQAEATARVLQDSPFATGPQYWRVYQLGLLRRVAGVDEAWEHLQEQ